MPSHRVHGLLQIRSVAACGCLAFSPLVYVVGMQKHLPMSWRVALAYRESKDDVGEYTSSLNGQGLFEEMRSSIVHP